MTDPARRARVSRKESAAAPRAQLIKAVLFDVDFTLIYPGPTFQGEGYRQFCVRYGIEVDPARFEEAVSAAGRLLDDADAARYDDEIYVGYTRRIIEGMGGSGARVDACAREIYREWAACQHFELYDEVPSVLRRLAESGVKVGLLSNSHRCLTSFQAHFELEGLITATLSSSEHGLMKPHPGIFNAALTLVGARPHEALMVGDSIRHDVDGALHVGMSAALVYRSDAPHPRAEELRARGVQTLKSLRELPAMLEGREGQDGREA